MGSQAQSKQNLSSQQSRKADNGQKKSPAAVRQGSPGQERPLGALVTQRPELLQPQDLPRLQRTAGNRAATALIQAKLVVGAAGNVYEDEADRIAEQVTDRRFGGMAARVTPLAASEGGIEVSGELEARLRAGQGGGSPLPAGVRRQMEERFGRDFGDVRLHADSLAKQLNSDLQARAFTHGRDIFLGRKAGDPATPAGQRLLAHELAHVVQQTGQAAAASPIQRFNEARDEDFRRAMRQRRHLIAPEDEPEVVHEAEEPDFIRALRRRRMDIAPEDEETVANYDQRLSTGRAPGTAFQQRQVSERNQEVQGVGSLMRMRKEAAALRQGSWWNRALESDYTNLGTAIGGYVGSGLSLGGSISGTVNAFDDKNKASGYWGSGFGIAGSAVSGLSSGVQFAGGMSKISRASRLMKSRSRAAQMLGKDLRSEGYQSSVESGLGVLGGLVGIGSNVSGIYTTQNADNTAADVSNKTLGTIGAGITTASEIASFAGGTNKYIGSWQRGKAASTFAQNTRDDDLKAIAERTNKSQKSTGSWLGNMLKGALNIGSSALGVASAFTTGDTKAYLSLAGTISGGLGAGTGLVQTEIERATGKQHKARAAEDAATLMDRIESRNSEAIKFASDVLKIPNANQLAEEDPESLKELLASRLTQYVA